MTFSRRCDPGEPARGKSGIRRCAAPALFLFLLAAATGAHSLEKGTPAPSPGTANPPGLLEPGAIAPGFVLRDAAGEPFDFAAENAKSPFLLVFFSIFCDPCRRELAVAQKLHERHLADGWRVAAVALDGAPLKHAVEGFARQEGFGFQVLIDELDARGTFKAADPYGVAEIPSTYVVGKGGRILFSRKGFVGEEELEKSMQSSSKP